MLVNVFTDPTSTCMLDANITSDGTLPDHSGPICRLHTGSPPNQDYRYGVCKYIWEHFPTEFLRVSYTIGTVVRRCCLGLRLLLLIVAVFLIRTILTICHSTPLSHVILCFSWNPNAVRTVNFPNKANAEPFELDPDQLSLSERWI